MDRISHLSHAYINLIEVGVRIGVIIIKEGTKAGSGPTMYMEVIQDIFLIIELVMGTIHEVIKGMEETIITKEAIMEIKIIIGIGVDCMKGRLKTEEIVEAQVIVYRGQVPELVQTEIGLDFLNVGNTIISQENVHLGKQVGKQSKYNKCLT